MVLLPLLWRRLHQGVPNPLLLCRLPLVRSSMFLENVQNEPPLIVRSARRVGLHKKVRAVMGMNMLMSVRKSLSLSTSTTGTSMEMRFSMRMTLRMGVYLSMGMGMVIGLCTGLRANVRVRVRVCVRL